MDNLVVAMINVQITKRGISFTSSLTGAEYSRVVDPVCNLPSQQILHEKENEICI
jgi:hypothetical protein